uniref:AlNc14C59G4393 protein n=1 Tax=Albugo laibachii Nc14 TaxID=890382 RepID=F0WCL3_9STRA|nr:AlNc14C59G4393 [Albugo laibachii Nc14]|eukprot:CCA18930.1 AlNc14C59G4393 [Albugo laibachii Nc14]
MKQFLQQIQRKIRRKEEADLARAHFELEQAASAHRKSNQDQEQRIYKAALPSYHERVRRSFKYNQDSVLDHQTEKSSGHFLAPKIRLVIERFWKEFSFQLAKCQKIQSIL